MPSGIKTHFTFAFDFLSMCFLHFIFFMLSQFCCRKILILFRFKDHQIAFRSDFRNHENFSETCPNNNLKGLSFLLNLSWHLIAIRKIFRNHSHHNMILYPSPFRAHPSSMLESTLHCLTHHDFLHVYLSESHTSLPYLQFIFLLHK